MVNWTKTNHFLFRSLPSLFARGAARQSYCSKVVGVLECVLEVRGSRTGLGTCIKIGHGQGPWGGAAPLWTMLDGLVACFADRRLQVDRRRGVWRATFQGVPLQLAPHFLSVYV